MGRGRGPSGGDVFNENDGRDVRCKPTPDRDGLIITFLERRDREVATPSRREAAAICGEEALRVRLPGWGLIVDESRTFTSLDRPALT
jgi:hypothetical protein